MKFIALLLISLVSSIFTFANDINTQNYRFKQLSIEDGLPQSTVFCVFQDSRDFVWIGTWDGLCRYDGRNLKVFQPKYNNKFTVNSGAIYDIAEGHDGMLYLATGSGGLNVYNPVDETFEHWTKDSSANSIVDNIIYDVLLASDSSLWFTSYNGVGNYNPKSRTMTSYSAENDSIQDIFSYSSNCVFEDQQANIWVGTYGGGLFKFNKNTRQFIEKPNTLNSELTFDQNVVSQIVGYSEDTLLLNTSIGIYKFNTKNNQYSTMDYPMCKANWIMVDSAKTLWIASDKKGIIKINATGKSEFINSSPYKRSSLPSNQLNYIYSDRLNNLWVGVNNIGLAYCNINPSPFFHYYKKNAKNTLIGNEVYGLAEDDNNNYWIATLSGLSIFNPTDKSFRNITSDGTKNTISNNDLFDVLNDGQGNMWLATATGVDQYNMKTKTFRHFKNIPGDSTSLPNTECFCLGIDKNEYIWVGTYHGLIKYNKHSKIWDQNIRDEEGNTFNEIVWHIAKDQQQKLWCCTEKGLFYLNDSSNVLHKFNKIPFLQLTEVNYIQFDNEGNYWIGTQRGLIKYSVKDENYTLFNTFNGLPNNVIYSILESDNAMWVSSNLGLSKIDKQTQLISNFNVNDGLQSNEFNVAALKTQNGMCLFGGINGLTAFYPHNVITRLAVPKLYFTNLSLNGVNVLPLEDRFGTIPLKQSVTHTNKITLSHNEKLIIFDFVATEYVKSDKIHYRYRILPDSKKWISLKRKNSVTLTMLPPGKYTLQVQSTNIEQKWVDNTISMDLSIIPPIYKKKWFIILQGLIIAFIILWYLRYRIRRIKRYSIKLEKTVLERTRKIESQKVELKAQRDRISEQKGKIEKAAESLEIKVQKRTKQLQIAKEAAEESERLKTAFLANMSHEIRTPMNAIVGFTDILVSTEVSEDDKLNYLEIIQTNSDNLLNLLNDILDISIIESGKVSFNYSAINVNDLLHSTIKSFEHNTVLLSKPDLTLKQVDNSENTLMVHADLYRLKQVLNNLISNAIKYTKQGFIEVSAIKQNAAICFIVKDTGIGIKSENIDKIFDRFHKVDNSDTSPYRGGGLGLAITKNLVELMNGKIWVESETDKGSSFFVCLPSHKKGVY